MSEIKLNEAPLRDPLPTDEVLQRRPDADLGQRFGRSVVGKLFAAFFPWLKPATDDRWYTGANPAIWRASAARGYFGILQSDAGTAAADLTKANTTLLGFSDSYDEGDYVAVTWDDTKDQWLVLDKRPFTSPDFFDGDTAAADEPAPALGATILLHAEQPYAAEPHLSAVAAAGGVSAGNGGRFWFVKVALAKVGDGDFVWNGNVFVRATSTAPDKGSISSSYISQLGPLLARIGRMASWPAAFLAAAAERIKPYGLSRLDLPGYAFRAQAGFTQDRQIRLLNGPDALGAGQWFLRPAAEDVSKLSETAFSAGHEIRAATAGNAKWAQFRVTDENRVQVGNEAPAWQISFADYDSSAGADANPFVEGDALTLYGSSPHVPWTAIVQAITSAAQRLKVPSAKAVWDLWAGGKGSVDIAGSGALTLTVDQWARNSVELSGARTGNRVLTLPAAPTGVRLVRDVSTGAYTTSVKLPGQQDADAVPLAPGDNLIAHHGGSLARLWPEIVRTWTNNDVGLNDEAVAKNLDDDDMVTVRAELTVGSDKIAQTDRFRFGSIDGTERIMFGVTLYNQALLLSRNGSSLEARRGGGASAAETVVYVERRSYAAQSLA